MKHCPHCKHKLGFGDFVGRYGSDTLAKHPASGHQREHLCLNCHHKLWIHYNAVVFKRLIGQYAIAAFLAAAFATNFGIKPLLQLDSTQMLISMMILLVLAMPLALTFAKYQSAVIKEER